MLGKLKANPYDHVAPMELPIVPAASHKHSAPTALRILGGDDSALIWRDKFIVTNRSLGSAFGTGTEALANSAGCARFGAPLGP